MFHKSKVSTSQCATDLLSKRLIVKAPKAYITRLQVFSLKKNVVFVVIYFLLSLIILFLFSYKNSKDFVHLSVLHVAIS